MVFNYIVIKKEEMIKMYLNSIYICLKDVFNVIYYKYYFIKVINFESVVVGVKVEEDLVIGICIIIFV